MMDTIILEYRKWELTITDSSATATTADGERFECYRQTSAENALRMVKGKVERLLGPEEWDMDYENEALL